MANISINLGYSVEIMVDTKGIPHTFLKITDKNGKEYFRGFAPQATSLIDEGKNRCKKPRME
ncbi:hypothetical protein [Campylobacter sputorum]|uniref:hypothetical protein n=1 Tax=Campylobacter sputorum TaxID=206 RepID=UPI00053C01FF|nr:hypothetical protein [Campylobacter sputorum]